MWQTAYLAGHSRTGGRRLAGHRYATGGIGQRGGARIHEKRRHGQRVEAYPVVGEKGLNRRHQPLLIAGDSPVFDKAGLSGAAVEARIVEHLRGPKLRVFKFKPKRGYKRRTGHRQELTRLEITSIKGN